MMAAVLDFALGAGAVLLGAVLLMVTAPFYLLTFAMRQTTRESPTWPKAQGTILESGVRSNRRANGLPGHRYRVRYGYEVEEEEYESDLVAPGSFPYGTLTWASRRAAQYPPGASVTVRYHPADPELAVLEPGWNHECWYLVIATTMLAVGGIASVCWGLVRVWNVVFRG